MYLLPVNSNPIVKTYSHHSYVHSIIDNREILCLSVNVHKKYKWFYHTVDTEASFYNELLLVSTKRTKKSGKELNREGFVYRKCFNKDILIIGIERIDLSAEHPIVNLFISDGNPKESADSNHIFRYGIHRYGISISENGRELYGCDVDFSKYKWFKLTFDKGAVRTYMSTDRKKWTHLYELKMTDRNLYIGINYNNLGTINKEEKYKSWLIKNYTALFLDKEKVEAYDLNETEMLYDVYIDYTINTNKNYRLEPLCANDYLDIQYFGAEEIMEGYGGIDRFVIQSLKHGYYVGICMDEFFVPERQAYHNYHFYHYNLCYGYDDKKQEYFIMGYNDKLTCRTIAKHTMLNENIDIRKEVIRYKRNDAVSQSVDYAGMISLSRQNHKAYKSDNRYLSGRDIINYILQESKAFDLFICDERISYLFYEYFRVLEYVFGCETDSIREGIVIARSINLMIVRGRYKSVDSNNLRGELLKLYQCFPEE